MTPTDWTTHKITSKTKPESDVKERLVAYQTINKLQAANLINNADKNAWSCSQDPKGPIRKSNQKRVLAEHFAGKSLPVIKPVEVRHTFSSVLRECARVTNDICKEIKIVRQLAEGGSDPSMISRLEVQKKEEERMREMRRMQEKHSSALLSREDAILAKQLSISDIKLQAERMRKEKKELYKKLENLRRDQSTEAAKIIERCHAMKQATREALNSMVDEKRKRAAEINAESRQLKLILSKQKNEDVQKKIHLIQGIKAIQTLRSRQIKSYNPTESSGLGRLGLLCEMSLTELKEELLSMKIKRNKEVECRNIAVRRERERRKNLMKINQRFLEWHKAR
ncbi:cilia- and flagella-associated protein 99 [Temnothorax americanus]|uniref:cilia- and flagella-associated protein 99 n=1 Tax=Temnothorax americanus TaxID=1964332 RepID=UPI0040687347